MSDTSILASLDALQDVHLALLQKLVQTPSANPPGDTRKACQLLTDHLTESGISFEIFTPLTDNPNIVATFEGGNGPGPHVVLNGHIDVFPPGPNENWKRDPLSGYNDGTYIHGRGTVDMKSGTAAIMFAFCHLFKQRQQLKGRLTLTIVSDEETGGKWGSKWLLENQSLKCKGDVLLNAEPGGLQSIRFGEKGTLRLTASIKTVGANGTYLNLSQGANRLGIHFMTQVIEKVEALKPNLPEKLLRHLQKNSVRKVAEEIMGKGAAGLFIRPTVNVGVWQGGLKVNMLPSTAEIQMDIRLPIGMQRDEVLDVINVILKDFPEIQIQIQEAASNPSNMCSEDHPIVHCFAEKVEKVIGIVPVTFPGVGGTDAKHWRYRDVPAYTYGLSPLSMGSNEERVSIKEYLNLIQIYTLAIHKYLT